MISKEFSVLIMLDAYNGLLFLYKVLFCFVFIIIFKCMICCVSMQFFCHPA